MSLLTDLVDLVMPVTCCGCSIERSGQLCGACAAAIRDAVAAMVVPDPCPHGLPPTAALAAYAASLRSVLLAYKERGRHRLAGPLGAALASVVSVGLAAQRGSVPARGPILLVPIPDTPSAARRRNGDHMLRLARTTACNLRRAGRPAAVAAVLVASDRRDSAELSAAQRLATANSAFTLSARRVTRLGDAARRGAAVVLVDDIVTTGATLAAAAVLLEEAKVRVCLASVLAATQRCRPVVRGLPRYSHGCGLGPAGGVLATNT